MLFRPETINLHELSGSAFENLREFAENKNISFINEIEEGFLVSADTNIISSLLHNLFSNAVKFSNRGGVIKIRAKHDNGFTLVSVSDNGVGISPEDQKLLFNLEMPYSRSGTDKEKGSGLGLLLCKEFVDLHKGKIWVESEPGLGTTFNFTISNRL